MSPSAKIESLIAENFTLFTFKAITTDINKNGVEKKTPLGMPVWKQINRTNFRNYIDTDNDKGTAIITGEISGISVLDFDDITEYNKLVSAYPDIKKHRTIKTKNGVHIYCQYTDKLTTTTNGFNSYDKVDIRNNDSIVFAPPTTYKLKDGSIAKYEDLGGEILPVPEFILADAKTNTKPTENKKTREEPNREITVNKLLADIRKAVREGKLDHKADSYNDWRDVGFIIHHTSPCDIGREIFHEFSRINIDKYDESYTNQFWNTIKQPKDKKPLTIATLYSWIQPLKIANTDLEAANILFAELGNRLKSYKGRVFYLVDNIWVCNENVDDSLLVYIMNSGIKSKGAKEGTYLPFVENISKAQNVAKTLLAKVRVENSDNNLYDKFHSTTKGKLCFNDGVLDFVNRCFTKWENISPFTIYTTQKINRNFAGVFANPPLEDMKKLEEALFKPKYGTKLETFYHFASRAIAGHCEDKRWATYLGNRNCGKGVEYELLKAAFGPYITTFELSNLLYMRKTAGLENLDCTKKSAWMLDLEFCRLAISQEIPSESSGLILNGKSLKKLGGGGDEIVARRNYDRYDTHFTCDATLYAQGNSSLQCDTPDCEETLVDFASIVEYVSQDVFDSKTEYEQETRYRVADPQIKKKCLTDEWVNAVIWLLFSNYKTISVPIIREDTSETINLPRLLEETFELTHNNEDIVSCEEVCSMLPDYNKKKIAMELSAKNIHKKKYQKKGPLYNKWIFCGMKKRIIEVFEDNI